MSSFIFPSLSRQSQNFKTSAGTRVGIIQPSIRHQKWLGNFETRAKQKIGERERERESEWVSVSTRECVFVCVPSRELLVGCFKESPASQVRDGQPDWPIKYSWRVCGHSLSNFRHLPKMLNSTFDSLPKFSKSKKNHKCLFFPILRFFSLLFY